MSTVLANHIKPPPPPNSVDFSKADVSTEATKAAVDSTATDQTSFKDLLLNSNDDMGRERAAKKNGGLAGAKTDDEFFKMLNDNINKDNKRVPTSKLDKDAFLKLFVTQIQNQDPLKPDDSSAMASQLAQFDSLEQMMNVNKTLEKMNTENQTTRSVGLVDFVGKEVTIDGGKLRLDKGKLTDANFAVEKDATKATVEVRNAAGVVVSEEDIGALKAGDHKLQWDGKNKEGRAVGDGTYTFAVVAKDAQDQTIPVNISSTVKITGVDMQDKGGAFFTEIGKVRVDEVSSVGKVGFKSTAAEATMDQIGGTLGKQAAAAAAEAASGGQPGANSEQPSEETIEQAMKAAANQMGAISKPAGAAPAAVPRPEAEQRQVQGASSALGGSSPSISSQSAKPILPGGSVIDIPVPQVNTQAGQPG